MLYDDIELINFLKTLKSVKSKTHGEFQLNGFQLSPPLENLGNFWQKMSDFDSHVQSWTSPEIVEIRTVISSKKYHEPNFKMSYLDGKSFLSKIRDGRSCQKLHADLTKMISEPLEQHRAQEMRYKESAHISWHSLTCTLSKAVALILSQATPWKRPPRTRRR